jgi:hypothetical protein
MVIIFSFGYLDSGHVPMGGDREVTIQMHCLNMFYCLEAIVIVVWFGEERSQFHLKVSPHIFRRTFRLYPQRTVAETLTTDQSMICTPCEAIDILAIRRGCKRYQFFVFFYYELIEYRISYVNLYFYF